MSEWLYLVIAAPFGVFKSTPKEKWYIVEVDCDRPGEGKFLANLLKPDVVLWTGVSRTHSVNFDNLINEHKFLSVEEVIAHEYGYLAENACDLVIVNGDSKYINTQMDRVKTDVITIKKQSNLDLYKVYADKTEFVIDKQKYIFGELLPEDCFYSIAMTEALLNYLGLKIDQKFPGFTLPPGRSSLFKGISNTTIIDSSYNATYEGMAAILQMFGQYPAQKKWVVCGDMIELGMEEKEEHEKLAQLIVDIKPDKIILMGPRVMKYTYPKLAKMINNPRSIERFTSPKETLEYLKFNLKGGETIMFKGARFMEGVIEQLLLNRADSVKLCRREAVWQARRKKWL